MKVFLFISFLIVLNVSGYSQDKKSYDILRTNKAPKIDGILDDAIWQKSQEAKDFTEFRPNIGVKKCVLADW